MNYIVLDTETTNGFESPLVYDCGWSIIDTNGNTLLTRSFVNSDIFLSDEFMSTAYFKDKIPMYCKDIKNGSRKLASYEKIRRTLDRDYRRYFCQAIVAHNARFDYKACQTTQRYITSSKKRYFFPYGHELFDTLKMAQQTFGKNDDYKSFCKENDYMVNGRPRLTAEILYRFITGNNSFTESHTGLEDTQIEKEIFLSCLKLNPMVECNCWADSECKYAA